MPETRWTRVVGSARVLRVARLLVMAEAVLLVGLVFVSAWRRLHYPYALDWLEEGTLTEVKRVVQGLPLYTAPTIHYTPFIYAPLFFWISGMVARVVGVGYPAMRLVSIGATAGLFAAVCGFCVSESARATRWLAGLVGVGLFATAYWITGGFFDVGRVDMLSLMLLMVGLWLVRRGWLVAAGAAFALAVLAKQGVLPVALLAMCAEWQRPRRVLAGVAALAVGCGVPLLWLARSSGGWSTFFLFKVAAGFALDKRNLLLLLPHEILPGVLLSVGVIVVTVLVAPPRTLGRAASFYGLTFVGMVLYTIYLRAHAGAAGNADLPAYLWVAFTAAVCVGRLMERMPKPAAVALLAVVLLQMVVWTNGPAYEVPSAEKVAQRAELVERLRAMPGEVLVVDHPQLALAAGKEAYADGPAMDGLITSGERGAGLQRELAGLVDPGRFTAIVVDGPLAAAFKDDRLPKDFLQVYRVRAELPVVDAVDQMTAPAWVFLKCGDAGLVRGLGIEDAGCGK